jgi:hypothetical protein
MCTAEQGGLKGVLNTIALAKKGAGGAAPNAITPGFSGGSAGSRSAGPLVRRSNARPAFFTPVFGSGAEA